MRIFKRLFTPKHKKLTQDENVFVEKVTRLVLDFMENGFLIKEDIIKRIGKDEIQIVFRIKSRQ